MAIALWALVLTLGVTFVAFLLEDLAESPDKEALNSPSAGAEASSRGGFPAPRTRNSPLTRGPTGQTWKPGGNSSTSFGGRDGLIASIRGSGMLRSWLVSLGLRVDRPGDQ